MGKDPRVDDYIEKAADFARPILTHLREIAHRAPRAARGRRGHQMGHAALSGER